MDCNDADPSIFPGADEICDGRDQDCDGTLDEGVRVTAFIDRDGDGYGTTQQTGCDASGLAEADGDCDDAAFHVHPGADDVCNGIDDDCDGDVDMDFEGVPRYADADGDGYGTGDGRLGCIGATNADDCDDADRWMNPGEAEECQPGDQDCDGFDLVSPWCISMDSEEADFTFYAMDSYLSWGGLPLRLDVLRDAAGEAILPVHLAPGSATRWEIQFQPLPSDPWVAVDDYSGAVLYADYGSHDMGRPTPSGVSMLLSNSYYELAVVGVPVASSVDVADGASTLIQGPDVAPVGSYGTTRPGLAGSIGGDVDGDGLDEILGVTWRAPVETAAVWSAVGAGTVGLAEATWSWNFTYEYYTPKIAPAGDLDDDGYADVAIRHTLPSRRHVLDLHLGSTLAAASGSPAADATWLGEGVDDDDLAFGPCGNAAASGQRSVLVGAPNFGRTWDGAEGTLYLVDDRAVAGTFDLRDATRIRSSVRGDGFAHSAACGDFNGDGFTDVVAGVPTAMEHGEITVGELNVFYGPLDGDWDAADVPFQILGDGSGANDYWFGVGVRAGDFNGDGVDDIAASGQSQQRFFLGSTYE